MLRDRTMKIAGGWLPMLLLGALLSACSGPLSIHAKPSKVDVDTLQSDILFGAPTAPAAAAPSTVNGVPVPLLVIPPITAPSQPIDQFFTGNNFTFPKLPTAAACPTAPPTAFPADIAGADVTNMVTPGQYRWAAGGNYDVTILTTTLSLPLPQFETRYVRDPTKIPDGPAIPGQPTTYGFKFQTIEPHIGGANGETYLMYWQVKENATQVQPLQPGTPGAGDPEAGLTLQQIDTLDSKGVVTSTIFKGVTGLQFLPLPVQPGGTFSSQSVDTSSAANNLQISATVGGRERIDACGTPIQAWGVDATLTPSGAGASNPSKLHYDVATQFGGLIVAFNVDQSYLGTTFHSATQRIGQAKPDPLPKQYDQ
ncbi:MAG: hypothetical protein ACYDGR_16945 [Candidatus Dormibacteria bacterium]